MEREPSRQPISKLEFEFERRKLAKDDVRELIYREVGSNRFSVMGKQNYSICLRIDYFMNCKQILEYHPQMLEEYMKGGEQISFLYPRCSIVLVFPPKRFYCHTMGIVKINIEQNPHYILYFPYDLQILCQVACLSV